MQLWRYGFSVCKTPGTILMDHGCCGCFAKISTVVYIVNVDF